MDSRRHTRLPVQVAAKIILPNGKSFNGTTMDISFGGAFVASPEASSIGLGTKCLLQFLVFENNHPHEIRFISQSIHSDVMGVGFQFKVIEAENYQNFMSLMFENSSSETELLDELSRHPGLEIKPRSQ